MATSTPDQPIDHIIADGVAAADPRHPPWNLKKASLVAEAARALSFGPRKESLPFWRRVSMTVRERRKRAADAAAEYDDPSAISLLDGRHTHGEYTPASAPKRARWLVMAIPTLILSFFGLVHLVNVLISLGPLLLDSSMHDFLSHRGQPGQLGAGLASYPTDFTRDVHPVPCHSHNDYWRRVPLFEALRYGCTGVEADVWLFPSTNAEDAEPELYVGHNTASLTPYRTFRSLYVDPLVEMLDRQNSIATRPVANTSAPERPLGVWDVDHTQTLVLLVDFKTDGPSLWPVVQEHLDPLRSRGYLSFWNGTDKVEGPITVVATGNAPFDLVIANATYRDIFFDAPLAMLYEDPDPALGTTRHQANPPASGQGSTGLPADATAASFDGSNSYYASVSFGKAVGHSLFWRGGSLSAPELRLIRGQIQGAERRGLKPRYWDTPGWPIGIRNHIWEALVKEGVDYLNVDDLKAAAQWDWRQRRHRTWF